MEKRRLPTGSGSAPSSARDSIPARDVDKHLVCTNCGGSDTAALIAALIAAIASAVAAIVTMVIARATSRTASATGQAAKATSEATDATREAAEAADREASATLKLVTADEQRREREVRGTARLISISGELALLETTIKDALRDKSFYWASPGAAWDQGERVIVAELAEHEADKLIDVVAELQKWARVASREAEASRPEGAIRFKLNCEDRKFLCGLVPKLRDSRQFLKRLASG